MNNKKDLATYKETQATRKARVQAEGNRFRSQVIPDKKHTYNRQKAKKGEKDGE